MPIGRQYCIYCYNLILKTPQYFPQKLGELMLGHSFSPIHLKNVIYL